MRRSVVLVMAALSFLLATAAHAEQTAAATATPVKIGAIYNLSGAQASLGQPSLRGAQLAVKQLNAAGGVLGRQIELKAYDGKTDPAVIRQHTQTLVTLDQAVALIGLNDTDMLLAAAPIAAKAEKVFLTSGATSPELPKQVPEYLYLACFGDNAQAAAGAEYAYETLHAKTAYLLFDKSMVYARLLTDYFKTRFVELGGEVILEDSYSGKNPDLSSHLRKLTSLARQPDLLYIAASVEEIGPVVKSIRNARITTPIMGGDSYDTPLLLRVAGVAANNAYYTTHVLLDGEEGGQRVKQFITAYKAEFGVVPESAFAGLGYDAVMLLADAIKRAGTDQPQAIREALQATRDLPGVTGSISFAPDSHIPKKTVTLVAVKNQRPTLAAEIIPKRVPPP